MRHNAAGAICVVLGLIAMLLASCNARGVPPPTPVADVEALQFPVYCMRVALPPSSPLYPDGVIRNRAVIEKWLPRLVVGRTEVLLKDPNTFMTGGFPCTVQAILKPRSGRGPEDFKFTGNYIEDEKLYGGVLAGMMRDLLDRGAL